MNPGRFHVGAIPQKRWINAGRGGPATPGAASVTASRLASIIASAASLLLGALAVALFGAAVGAAFVLAAKVLL